MDVNNLELYKVFYVVANTGNISKAADLLYTGQPSVSKSIIRLENLLEVKLFLRSTKGVRLTKEGELLQKYISNAMQEISSGELALKKMSKNANYKITLGISATLYKSFILPHLKSFLKKYSNFSINFVDCSTSHSTLDLVRSEKVDLGIVSKPFNLEGLEFIPISSIQEIFIAAPNYLTKLGVHTMQEFFQKVTFISLQKGNITREYNEEYLKKHNVYTTPEITATNMDFIVELVKLEIGAGIVFKEIVHQDLQRERLMEVDFLPPIPKRDIGIAIKKNRLPFFALNEFINYYANING